MTETNDFLMQSAFSGRRKDRVVDMKHSLKYLFQLTLSIQLHVIGTTFYTVQTLFFFVGHVSQGFHSDNVGLNSL